MASYLLVAVKGRGAAYNNAITQSLKNKNLCNLLNLN
jgi:hypothetical protein